MLCMIRSGHDGTDPVSAAGVMKSVVRTAVWLMLALAAPAFGATVDYLHTDALGSVVAVSNSAGVVIERREYEPYGRQLVPVVPEAGPAYIGHVSDAATGLSYMQQRYYDPQIGRFLSVDPVSADTVTGWNFNRYNYAANNPYKFKDPDGRIIETAWDVRSEEHTSELQSLMRITYDFFCLNKKTTTTLN